MKVNLDYQGCNNMIISPSIGKCLVKAQMGSKLCSVTSRRTPSSCSFCLHPRNSKANPANIVQVSQRSCVTSSVRVRDSDRHLKISLSNDSTSMRFLLPRQRTLPKINLNVGPATSSPLQGYASAGLICGMFVCYSSFEPVHAEVFRDSDEDDNDVDERDSSCAKLWHGKKVYTDYSITGIPGDGRCMFRSVSHGACLRCGEPAPSETRQRELADQLRARVADEFIKRREESEWFVEGDFDTYVSQMRKPHVWGGEPELFMASHVLRMPIAVYIHDVDAGGLIAIAEYGQEYGKKNPIRVLYHGFGHYDALQIPGNNIKPGKSRL